MSTKKPTFEQAINAAMLWCNAWENGELSDEVLADRVSELLCSSDGTRGFFVVSLASDCPLIDRLPEPILLELRKSGKAVVDLTVRNLAMSTAMALHHKRNENKSQQNESEKISRRCIELLRLLEPNTVKKSLENMLEATLGKGYLVSFIKRWNYDEDQIAAIVNKINSVAQI